MKILILIFNQLLTLLTLKLSYVGYRVDTMNCCDFVCKKLTTLKYEQEVNNELIGLSRRHVCPSVLMTNIKGILCRF